MSDPKPLSIPVIGGVNRRVDPRRIDDTEMYSTKNVLVDDGGIPHTRSGSSLIQPLEHFLNGFAPTISVSAAVKVWPKRFSTQTQFGFYACGYAPSATDMYGYVGLTDSAGAWNAGTNIRVESAITGTKAITWATRPQSFEMNGIVYIVGGFKASATGNNILKIDYSDPNVTTLGSGIWAGSQSITRSARVCTKYRNRAVYADFVRQSGSAVNWDDYVVMSDVDQPLTVGTNALTTRAFRVGDRSDGRIVAMLEIMQSQVASGTQAALLVLREFAAYIVNGELNESTDTTDPFESLTISRINYNCGCASAETVARTPYGVMWTGHDQVWLMADGQLPRPVGKKIVTEIQASHPSRRPSFNAVYHNGYYQLFVTDSTSAASAPFSSVVAANVGWYLDMTGGPPQGDADARWFGPMWYADPSGPSTTSSTVMYSYIDQPVDGRPQCVHVRYDTTVSSGRYSVLVDTAPTTDPYTDATDSIGTTVQLHSELVSKKYEMQDPATEKIFHAGEAVLQVTTAAAVTFTAAGDTSAAPTATPAGTTDYEALGFTASGGSKVPGKTLQFTLSYLGGKVSLASWIAWVEMVPRRPSI